MKPKTRLPLTPRQLEILCTCMQLSSESIDDALLLESQTPPFYPTDAAWQAFFLEQKQACTPLNDLLLAAAAHSAPQRRRALATDTRTPDKQGVFSTLIIPDFEDPGKTLIVKIRRSAAVGKGFGFFGGFLEYFEMHNFLLGLQRERREEAGEILPPAIAAEFCTIADRGLHLPLFQCRDDSHVIERGWGWRVNANAFVTVITNPDDQKRLKELLASGKFTPNKQLDVMVAAHSGGMQETDGLAVFTLERAPEAMQLLAGQDSAIAADIHADAPATITSHFYGHEGLGEILGLGKAFQILRLSFTVFDHYFSRPAILPFISAKMQLTPSAVLQLAEDVMATPFQVEVDGRITANGEAINLAEAPRPQVPAAAYAAFRP